MKRLLIANRGEIAVRVARTAAEIGVETVAVFAEDDAASRHVTAADSATPLRGVGPAAYLDVAQLVGAARALDCDALHPGYGFLSENAALARACAEAGVTFVGPSPQTLELFGDKARARALAQACGVPVLPGTSGPTSLDEAQAFLSALGQGGTLMVKAVSGGGGRGMRRAASPQELEEAFARCASEAMTAFGDDALYVERFLARARHVEVQVAGDGQAVVHLHDRECSLQRQRQKLIEIAPADMLPDALRETLFTHALALAGAAQYRGLGTLEFLVPADGGEAVFIEGNARLQVEHTVTEAITGLDLVRLQLEIADGRTLADLGLADGAPPPRGRALQARVNLETMTDDGAARPTGGVLTLYEPPTGPGVRVDGFAYAGYATSARYDALVAKVVVHSGAGGLPELAAKARRALAEFRIEGAGTNIGFLQALLAHPEVAAGEAHTRFVDEHIAELVHGAEAYHPRGPGGGPPGATPTAARVVAAPDGTEPLSAPLQGTVVALAVAEGEAVRAGQPVAVLEAMKMEHVIAASVAGVVRRLAVRAGEVVLEGQPLAWLEPSASTAGEAEADDAVDLDEIRPDLAEVLERHRVTLDEARPEAVARRRRTGQRTARENVADLLDPGSFTEYGQLVVGGRRRRATPEELIRTTPADGIVLGLGAINGDLFPPEKARAAVMAYDYTVLAGTQGAYNHYKMDRLCELALRLSLPVVAFTEGGGGRPGDTEWGPIIRGFEYWARLSGAVPLIGVTSGRCFAGNAAILGCCDVVIATRDAVLGMGGPAMVEGGGLGVFKPEEIGPAEVMEANGVIDILVEDEAAGVAAARKYLSYFQGPLEGWSCADQRLLRRAIPENRLRAYDIRKVIGLIADEGGVLELRPRFGRAMVTALIRVEGRPMGLIANNPAHLAGAVDADGADKAARFLQLCEAFDLPVLSLSDTPGMMVGPEAEKAGTVRHGSRLFVIGANLTVPILAVVLRKSYGLGAVAMVGGSYNAPVLTVAWPTAEFGAMGLEGSVRLGYRDQLAAVEDPAERQALFDRKLAQAYAGSKALRHAMKPELDDVIDPADTRRWIMAGLKALPPTPPRTGKKLRWIDAW